MSIPDPVPALMKGTLDLLILRTLELRPLHGVAIADRIAQTSQHAFLVKAGSLFPALHRLERDGWISGAWQVGEEARRVRCYTLTPAGRRHLSTEKVAWRRVVAAMTQVLESE